MLGAVGEGRGGLELPTSAVIGSRRGTSESDLGDGDAVQGDVELTIAAAVEAMTLVIPSPDRNRPRAGHNGLRDQLAVAPREQVLCAGVDSRRVVHCETEDVGQSVGHVERECDR